VLLSSISNTEPDSNKQVGFSCPVDTHTGLIGSNEVYLEHMDPIFSEWFRCKDQTFELKGW